MPGGISWVKGSVLGGRECFLGSSECFLGAREHFLAQRECFRWQGMFTGCFLSGKEHFLEGFMGAGCKELFAM